MPTLENYLMNIMEIEKMENEAVPVSTQTEAE
ncbi:MAG: hypothetical protein ACI90U_000823 [Pseudomonadales bacterium]|jgi:hypothetical protein